MADNQHTFFLEKMFTLYEKYTLHKNNENLRQTLRSEIISVCETLENITPEHATTHHDLIQKYKNLVT